MGLDSELQSIPDGQLLDPHEIANSIGLPKSDVSPEFVDYCMSLAKLCEEHPSFVALAGPISQAIVAQTHNNFRSPQINQRLGETNQPETVVSVEENISSEVEYSNQLLRNLLQTYFGDFRIHQTVGRADKELFALLLLLNPRPAEVSRVNIDDNWTADYARFGMPISKSVKKKPAQIKLKWYGPVNKSPTIIFAERLTAATKLSEQLIFETLAVYVQKQKIVIPIKQTSYTQQEIKDIFTKHCNIAGSMLQNFVDIKFISDDLLIFRNDNQEEPSAELVVRIVNFLKELLST